MTNTEFSLILPANDYRPHLAEGHGPICGSVTTGAVQRIMMLSPEDVLDYRGNLCEVCRLAAKFNPVADAPARDLIDEYYQAAFRYYDSLDGEVTALAAHNMHAIATEADQRGVTIAFVAVADAARHDALGA